MIEDSDLNAYFAGFGERITAIARAHGVNVDLPSIDSRVTAELLGLAGSVAHRAERKYAPLATFLAGFAAGSLCSAGQLKTDSELNAFIVEVRAGLGN